MDKPSLPLTKSNLNKLQDESLIECHKDEIFSRFYQELIKNHHPKVEPNPDKADVVVASPKVLPFPYHNDSMFLPTAEHIQYKQHRCGTDASQSSKISSSFMDSNVSKRRPKSMPIPRDSCSMTTNSSYKKHQQWERRSLTSQYEAMVTFAAGNQRRSSIRSSITSISTSCSNIRDKGVSCLTKSISRKPRLLKRLLRLFTKQKSQETQKRQHKISHHGPVWYCQYSSNP
ncbi:hypothetical protein BD560DRAFT_395702 [Blakeslea trispora]|nr:hypothetical protein BD560DRAFT_395702 [Blakeslea trispora]